MSKTTVASTGIDLSDNFAFSGTVTGASKIVQVKNIITTTEASGATTMPHDDTIPQNTEGNEFFTLAITPTSATNKLLILVSFNGVCETALAELMVGLYQDSTADAIAVGNARVGTQTIANHIINFQHFMTAGTTSATTFKIRAGNGGGYTRMNDYLSTANPSGMTIMEIAE